MAGLQFWDSIYAYRVDLNESREVFVGKEGEGHSIYTLTRTQTIATGMRGLPRPVKWPVEGEKS